MALAFLLSPFALARMRGEPAKRARKRGSWVVVGGGVVGVVAALGSFGGE